MSATTAVAPCLRVVVGSTSYNASQLNEYGFRVAGADQPDRDEIHSGELSCGEFTQAIRFKVRRSHNEWCQCGFHKMELAEQEKLRTFIESNNDPTLGSNELDNKSYDELASGDTVTGETTPSSGPRPRSQMKTFVALILSIGIIGVVLLVGVLIQLRYTVKVSNAVVIGNYMPVNTRVAGEVAEVFVDEGQRVRKGTVLLRLTNEELAIEHELSRAAVNTAREEVAAYERLLRDFAAKMNVAKQKLGHEISAATADLKKARFDLETATTQVKRLQPLAKDDNIALVDYELAVSNRSALKALYENKRSVVSILQVAQEATKKNILLIGDRMDDSRGQIRAKLDIARAQLKKLIQAERLAARRAAGIDVVAPRDGTIYAIYRHSGEYLKVAEEALAMNLPTGSWATGHVAAAEAIKIRPGQPVSVVIPSMGLQVKGQIAALGHRAVHGKGGYSAEFRGEGTDVPIKVSLNELPSGVPSGIRLKMVIHLGYPWQKRSVEAADLTMDFDNVQVSQK